MSHATSAAADWAELYHQSLGHPPPPPPPTHFSAAPPTFGRVSDSTVVTTTSTASPVAGSNIEGRVGKSGRRRSRASRRAPTTLLNTDAANFRAMVQQFTGIPSGPYSSGFQTGGGPVINFGLGFNEQLRPPAPFRQQQQQQLQYQAQQFQQYHQPQQHDGNLYTLGNNGGSDGFIQGFSSNPNPREEEFFINGVSGQLTHRTNGYTL